MKVGVGLMIRHCKARQELHRRIEAGEIGEIGLLRAYRMAGQAAHAGPCPSDQSEVGYQIRRFHSFLWASGGIFSDFNIHQIDECCWMGLAGARTCDRRRHYRGNSLTRTSTIIPWNTHPMGPSFLYRPRRDRVSH